MKWYHSHKLELFLWGMAGFSMAFSLKFNSMALNLLGLAVLINYFRKAFIPNRKSLLLFASFVLLFLLYVLTGLNYSDDNVFFSEIEKKYSLVLIPLGFLLTKQSFEILKKWFGKGLILGVLIAGSHMLLFSIIQSIEHRDFSFFFYHNFTQPYSIGAIYFSFLLSISIFFCLKVFKLYYLSIPFLLFLLLASSKLFIILTIPYAIFVVWKDKLALSKYRWISLVIIVCVLIIGLLPFRNRINELSLTELKVLEQEQFAYDTPFDGLSIRLLQWKFGLEILSEQNAFLFGVGIANKQSLLDSKYKQKGVYTGNPELGDQGYLGYNFHNQFIETMIASGISGLASLLLIIILIFGLYKKSDNWPVFIYLLPLFFFLTESVLERQTGIFMFCLLFSTPILTLDYKR